MKYLARFLAGTHIPSSSLFMCPNEFATETLQGMGMRTPSSFEGLEFRIEETMPGWKPYKLRKEGSDLKGILFDNTLVSRHWLFSCKHGLLKPCPGNEKDS